MLLLQGEADTTVFPVFTNTLNTELRGKGDSVDYRTFPGATHATVVIAGYAAATAWLATAVPLEPRGSAPVALAPEHQLLGQRDPRRRRRIGEHRHRLGDARGDGRGRRRRSTP